MSGGGKTVAVGAMFANAGTGAEYLYLHGSGGWRQAVELVASDGAAGDEFGSSSALSQDSSTLVVGAEGAEDNAGAAYVFTGHSKKWRQAAELTADDGAASDELGYTAAISADGSTIVLGAFGHDGEAGAAYVFTRHRNSWRQTAELTAPDTLWFGDAVAVAGNGSTVVVGSPGNDGDAGEAYVFTRHRERWRRAGSLLASDGATGDSFADTVAISADGATVVAGAYAHDTTQGAAYVFTRDGATWKQSAELTASDASQGTAFGFPVAISADGSTAVVGSAMASYYRGTPGSAYVFTSRGETWRQRAELTASDGVAGDYFGAPVVVTPNGSTVLVGAECRQGNTGAAYLFTR